MFKNFAPIALFTYNRPLHTQKVLESLSANIGAKQSILYIFCDGPKENADHETLLNINATRAIVRNECRFKEVIIVEQPNNKGLASSIIEGVTDVINRHETIIVLEDDLVSSPWLLTYMNNALEYYAQDSRVASIHGYLPPVKNRLPDTFFLRGSDCWSWATWKRAWDLFNSDGVTLLKELNQKNLSREFDFDNSIGYTAMLRDQINGKNDSWFIRWHASLFLKNRLTLHPGRSLVQNIGNDSTGYHSGTTAKYDVVLYEHEIKIGNITVEESDLARKAIASWAIAPSSWRNPAKWPSAIVRRLKMIFKEGGI